MADISITATSVIASGNSNTETGVAGAAITTGHVVYKDSTTGKFGLSDANGASADIKSVYGVALNGAAIGQPVTVARSGDITVGGTLVAGTAYYLSATPGGIAPVADLTTGDAVVQLGLAKSTTVLAFRPQNPGVTL